MESLKFSLDIIMPIFILMTMGYCLKVYKILDDDIIKKLNTLLFNVFLPILIFKNIAGSNINLKDDFKVIAFSVITLTVVAILFFYIVIRIEKDDKKRGVMIQGIFRSNYLLIGVPIASSILGEDNIATTVLLSTVLIPVYNILGVIVLEYFRGNKKIDFVKIMISTIKNPMIIASLLGILVARLNIYLPSGMQSAIKDAAQIASPLALIVLGASFKVLSIKNTYKQVVFTSISRLIIVPVVAVPLTIISGFSSNDIVSIIPMLITPTATTTFTMAAHMDGDAELASQIVVVTSLFSIITITMVIATLKEFSII